MKRSTSKALRIDLKFQLILVPRVVFRNRESSWLAPLLQISGTWEISRNKSETCAKCNSTSRFILVSVMVSYTFAKTTIFIASLQIIQNWNAPLVWSNYLLLSTAILIYEKYLMLLVICNIIKKIHVFQLCNLNHIFSPTYLYIYQIDELREKKHWVQRSLCVCVFFFDSLFA